MTSLSENSDKGEDGASHNTPLSRQHSVTGDKTSNNSQEILKAIPAVTENKHGGKLSDAKTHDGKELNCSPSKFTIPKIQREKMELLHEVSLQSYEFQQDVFPKVTATFLDQNSSCKNFNVTKCFTVQNTLLTKKFIKRKMTMKCSGYTEKELSESYGFLAVQDLKIIEEMCKNGLKIGNREKSVLGHPQMGVQITRYADILPVTSKTVWKGQILVFKYIKGKIKTVVENLTGIYSDPTPNYDSHVNKLVTMDTKHLNPDQLLDYSQVYLYEYEDGNLVDYPSQVLLYAVLQVEFTNSSIPTGKTSSPGQCKTYESSSRPTEEYITWNGKVALKGYCVCEVIMTSASGYFKPVRLGTSINICNRSDISRAEEKYFSKLTISNKCQEVYWKKRYINFAELKPKLESMEHFKKIATYLSDRHSLAIVKPDEHTVLFLIPQCSLTNRLGLSDSNKEEEKNVLHCMFLSKQSAQFKSPKFTYTMFKTQGEVLGIEGYSFRKTMQPYDDYGFVNPHTSSSVRCLFQENMSNNSSEQTWSPVTPQNHLTNSLFNVPSSAVLSSPGRTPYYLSHGHDSPAVPLKTPVLSSPQGNPCSPSPRPGEPQSFSPRHASPNVCQYIRGLGSSPIISPLKSSPIVRLVSPADFDGGFSPVASRNSKLKLAKVVHTFDCQLSLEIFENSKQKRELKVNDLKPSEVNNLVKVCESVFPKFPEQGQEQLTKSSSDLPEDPHTCDDKSDKMLTTCNSKPREQYLTTNNNFHESVDKHIHESVIVSTNIMFQESPINMDFYDNIANKNVHESAANKKFEDDVTNINSYKTANQKLHESDTNKNVHKSAYKNFEYNASDGNVSESSLKTEDSDTNQSVQECANINSHKTANQKLHESATKNLEKSAPIKKFSECYINMEDNATNRNTNEIANKNSEGSTNKNISENSTNMDDGTEPGELEKKMETFSGNGDTKPELKKVSNNLCDIRETEEKMESLNTTGTLFSEVESDVDGIGSSDEMKFVIDLNISQKRKKITANNEVLLDGPRTPTISKDLNTVSPNEEYHQRTPQKSFSSPETTYHPTPSSKSPQVNQEHHPTPSGSSPQVNQEHHHTVDNFPELRNLSTSSNPSRSAEKNINENQLETAHHTTPSGSSPQVNQEHHHTIDNLPELRNLSTPSKPSISAEKNIKGHQLVHNIPVPTTDSSQQLTSHLLDNVNVCQLTSISYSITSQNVDTTNHSTPSQSHQSSASQKLNASNMLLDVHFPSEHKTVLTTPSLPCSGQSKDGRNVESIDEDYSEKSKSDCSAKSIECDENALVSNVQKHSNIVSNLDFSMSSSKNLSHFRSITPEIPVLEQSVIETVSELAYRKSITPDIPVLEQSFTKTLSELEDRKSITPGIPELEPFTNKAVPDCKSVTPEIPVLEQSFTDTLSQNSDILSITPEMPILYPPCVDLNSTSRERTSVPMLEMSPNVNNGMFSTNRDNFNTQNSVVTLNPEGDADSDDQKNEASVDNFTAKNSVGTLNHEGDAQKDEASQSMDHLKIVKPKPYRTTIPKNDTDMQCPELFTSRVDGDALNHHFDSNFSAFHTPEKKRSTHKSTNNASDGNTSMEENFVLDFDLSSPGFLDKDKFSDSCISQSETDEKLASDLETTTHKKILAGKRTPKCFSVMKPASHKSVSTSDDKLTSDEDSDRVTENKNIPSSASLSKIDYLNISSGQLNKNKNFSNSAIKSISFKNKISLTGSTAKDEKGFPKPQTNQQHTAIDRISESYGDESDSDYSCLKESSNAPHFHNNFEYHVVDEVYSDCSVETDAYEHDELTYNNISQDDRTFDPLISKKSFANPDKNASLEINKVLEDTQNISHLRDAVICLTRCDGLLSKNSVDVAKLGDEEKCLKSDNQISKCDILSSDDADSKLVSNKSIKVKQVSIAFDKYVKKLKKSKKKVKSDVPKIKDNDTKISENINSPTKSKHSKSKHNTDQCDKLSKSLSDDKLSKHTHKHSQDANDKTHKASSKSEKLDEEEKHKHKSKEKSKHSKDKTKTDHKKDSKSHKRSKSDGHISSKTKHKSGDMKRLAKTPDTKSKLSPKKNDEKSFMKANHFKSSKSTTLEPPKSKSPIFAAAITSLMKNFTIPKKSNSKNLDTNPKKIKSDPDGPTNEGESNSSLHGGTKNVSSQKQKMLKTKSVSEETITRIKSNNSSADANSSNQAADSTFENNLKEQLKSAGNITEKLLKISTIDVQKPTTEVSDATGKATSQSTENRKARQFHPYSSPTKQSKKKQWASFGLAVSDLQVLMQDLTTSLFQPSQKVDWQDPTGKQQHRFDNYVFERSQVVEDDEEVVIDMTEDDFFDFEERKKLADLVENDDDECQAYPQQVDPMLEEEIRIYSRFEEEGYVPTWDNAKPLLSQKILPTQLEILSADGSLINEDSQDSYDIPSISQKKLPTQLEILSVDGSLINENSQDSYYIPSLSQKLLPSQLEILSVDGSLDEDSQSSYNKDFSPGKDGKYLPYIDFEEVSVDGMIKAGSKRDFATTKKELSKGDAVVNEQVDVKACKATKNKQKRSKKPETKCSSSTSAAVNELQKSMLAEIKATNKAQPVITKNISLQEETPLLPNSADVALPKSLSNKLFSPKSLSNNNSVENNQEKNPPTLSGLVFGRPSITQKETCAASKVTTSSLPESKIAASSTLNAKMANTKKISPNTVAGGEEIKNKTVSSKTMPSKVSGKAVKTDVTQEILPISKKDTAGTVANKLLTLGKSAKQSEMSKMQSARPLMKNGQERSNDGDTKQTMTADAEIATNLELANYKKKTNHSQLQSFKTALSRAVQMTTKEELISGTLAKSGTDNTSTPTVTTKKSLVKDTIITIEESKQTNLESTSTLISKNLEESTKSKTSNNQEPKLASKPADTEHTENKTLVKKANQAPLSKTKVLTASANANQKGLGITDKESAMKSTDSVFKPLTKPDTAKESAELIIGTTDSTQALIANSKDSEMGALSKPETGGPKVDLFKTFKTTLSKQATPNLTEKTDKAQSKHTMPELFKESTIIDVNDDQAVDTATCDIKPANAQFPDKPIVATEESKPVVKAILNPKKVTTQTVAAYLPFESNQAKDTATCIKPTNGKVPEITTVITKEIKSSSVSPNPKKMTTTTETTIPLAITNISALESKSAVQTTMIDTKVTGTDTATPTKVSETVSSNTSITQLNKGEKILPTKVPKIVNKMPTTGPITFIDLTISPVKENPQTASATQKDNCESLSESNPSKTVQQSSTEKIIEVVNFSKKGETVKSPSTTNFNQKDVYKSKSKAAELLSKAMDKVLEEAGNTIKEYELAKKHSTLNSCHNDVPKPESKTSDMLSKAMDKVKKPSSSQPKLKKKFSPIVFDIKTKSLTSKKTMASPCVKLFDDSEDTHEDTIVADKKVSSKTKVHDKDISLSQSTKKHMPDVTLATNTSRCSKISEAVKDKKVKVPPKNKVLDKDIALSQSTNVSNVTLATNTSRCSKISEAVKDKKVKVPPKNKVLDKDIALSQSTNMADVTLATSTSQCSKISEASLEGDKDIYTISVITTRNLKHVQNEFQFILDVAASSENNFEFPEVPPHSIDLSIADEAACPGAVDKFQRTVSDFTGNTLFNQQYNSYKDPEDLPIRDEDAYKDPEELPKRDEDAYKDPKDLPLVGETSKTQRSRTVSSITGNAISNQQYNAYKDPEDLPIITDGAASTEASKIQRSRTVSDITGNNMFNHRFNAYKDPDVMLSTTKAKSSSNSNLSHAHQEPFRDFTSNSLNKPFKPYSSSDSVLHQIPSQEHPNPRHLAFEQISNAPKLERWSFGRSYNVAPEDINKNYSDLGCSVFQKTDTENQSDFDNNYGLTNNYQQNIYTQQDPNLISPSLQFKRNSIASYSSLQQNAYYQTQDNSCHWVTNKDPGSPGETSKESFVFGRTYQEYDTNNSNPFHSRVHPNLRDRNWDIGGYPEILHGIQTSFYSGSGMKPENYSSAYNLYPEVTLNLGVDSDKASCENMEIKIDPRQTYLKTAVNKSLNNETDLGMAPNTDLEDPRNVLHLLHAVDEEMSTDGKSVNYNGNKTASYKLPHTNLRDISTCSSGHQDDAQHKTVNIDSNSKLFKPAKGKDHRQYRKHSTKQDCIKESNSLESYTTSSTTKNYPEQPEKDTSLSDQNIECKQKVNLSIRTEVIDDAETMRNLLNNDLINKSAHPKKGYSKDFHLEAITYDSNAKPKSGPQKHPLLDQQLSKPSCITISHDLVIGPISNNLKVTHASFGQSSKVTLDKSSFSSVLKTSPASSSVQLRPLAAENSEKEIGGVDVLRTPEKNRSRCSTSPVKVTGTPVMAENSNSSEKDKTKEISKTIPFDRYMKCKRQTQDKMETSFESENNVQFGSEYPVPENIGDSKCLDNQNPSEDKPTDDGTDVHEIMLDMWKKMTSVQKQKHCRSLSTSPNLKIKTTKSDPPVTLKKSSSLQSLTNPSELLRTDKNKTDKSKAELSRTVKSKTELSRTETIDNTKLKEPAKDISKIKLQLKPQAKNSADVKKRRHISGIHPKCKDYWNQTVEKLTIVNRSKEYISSSLPDYQVELLKYSDDPRLDKSLKSKIRHCPNSGLNLKSKVKTKTVTPSKNATDAEERNKHKKSLSCNDISLCKTRVTTGAIISEELKTKKIDSKLSESCTDSWRSCNDKIIIKSGKSKDSYQNKTQSSDCSKAIVKDISSETLADLNTKANTKSSIPNKKQNSNKHSLVDPKTETNTKPSLPNKNNLSVQNQHNKDNPASVNPKVVANKKTSMTNKNNVPVQNQKCRDNGSSSDSKVEANLKPSAPSTNTLPVQNQQSQEKRKQSSSDKASKTSSKHSLKSESIIHGQKAQSKDKKLEKPKCKKSLPFTDPMTHPVVSVGSKRKAEASLCTKEIKICKLDKTKPIQSSKEEILRNELIDHALYSDVNLPDLEKSKTHAFTDQSPDDDFEKNKYTRVCHQNLDFSSLIGTLEDEPFQEKSSQKHHNDVSKNSKPLVNGPDTSLLEKYDPNDCSLLKISMQYAETSTSSEDSFKRSFRDSIPDSNSSLHNQSISERLLKKESQDHLEMKQNRSLNHLQTDEVTNLDSMHGCLLSSDILESNISPKDQLHHCYTSTVKKSRNNQCLQTTKKCDCYKKDCLKCAASSVLQAQNNTDCNIKRLQYSDISEDETRHRKCINFKDVTLSSSDISLQKELSNCAQISHISPVKVQENTNLPHFAKTGIPNKDFVAKNQTGSTVIKKNDDNKIKTGLTPGRKLKPWVSLNKDLVTKNKTGHAVTKEICEKTVKTGLTPESKLKPWVSLNKDLVTKNKTGHVVTKETSENKTKTGLTIESKLGPCDVDGGSAASEDSKNKSITSSVVSKTVKNISSSNKSKNVQDSSSYSSKNIHTVLSKKEKPKTEKDSSKSVDISQQEKLKKSKSSMLKEKQSTKCFEKVSLNESKTKTSSNDTSKTEISSNIASKKTKDDILLTEKLNKVRNKTKSKSLNSTIETTKSERILEDGEIVSSDSSESKPKQQKSSKHKKKQKLKLVVEALTNIKELNLADSIANVRIERERTKLLKRKGEFQAESQEKMQRTDLKKDVPKKSQQILKILGDSQEITRLKLEEVLTKKTKAGKHKLPKNTKGEECKRRKLSHSEDLNKDSATKASTKCHESKKSINSQENYQNSNVASLKPSAKTSTDTTEKSKLDKTFYNISKSLYKNQSINEPFGKESHHSKVQSSKTSNSISKPSSVRTVNKSQLTKEQSILLPVCNKKEYQSNSKSGKRSLNNSQLTDDQDQLSSLKTHKSDSVVKKVLISSDAETHPNSKHTNPKGSDVVWEPLEIICPKEEDLLSADNMVICISSTESELGLNGVNVSSERQNLMNTQEILSSMELVSDSVMTSSDSKASVGTSEILSFPIKEPRLDKNSSLISSKVQSNPLVALSKVKPSHSKSNLNLKSTQQLLLDKAANSSGFSELISKSLTENQNKESLLYKHSPFSSFLKEPEEFNRFPADFNTSKAFGNLSVSNVPKRSSTVRSPLVPALSDDKPSQVLMSHDSYRNSESPFMSMDIDPQMNAASSTCTPQVFINNGIFIGNPEGSVFKNNNVNNFKQTVDSRQILNLQQQMNTMLDAVAPSAQSECQSWEIINQLWQQFQQFCKAHSNVLRQNQSLVAPHGNSAITNVSTSPPESQVHLQDVSTVLMDHNNHGLESSRSPSPFQVSMESALSSSDTKLVGSLEESFQTFTQKFQQRFDDIVKKASSSSYVQSSGSFQKHSDLVATETGVNIRPHQSQLSRSNTSQVPGQRIPSTYSHMPSNFNPFFSPPATPNLFSAPQLLSQPTFNPILPSPPHFMVVPGASHMLPIQPPAVSFMPQLYSLPMKNYNCGIVMLDDNIVYNKTLDCLEKLFVDVCLRSDTQKWVVLVHRNVMANLETWAIQNVMATHRINLVKTYINKGLVLIIHACPCDNSRSMLMERLNCLQRLRNLEFPTFGIAVLVSDVFSTEKTADGTLMTNVEMFCKKFLQ